MWLRFSPSSEGWHVGWSESVSTLKRQTLTENRKQREGMKALLARSQARTSEQCERKGPMLRYEPPPPVEDDDESVSNQPVGCLSGRTASSEAQQPQSQHMLHHMSSAGNVVVASVSTPISKRRGIGGTAIANADKVANALLTSHSDAQANHVCGACEKEKAPFARCDGCELVYYCDLACRRTHWPSHKPRCKYAQGAKLLSEHWLNAGSKPPQKAHDQLAEAARCAAPSEPPEPATCRRADDSPASPAAAILSRFRQPPIRQSANPPICLSRAHTP